MQGAVTHIWMSPDTGKKSRYGPRTLGGIAGIVALAMLLVCGGTALGLSMGWPMELVSLALCLGCTALAVLLAVGLGRRSTGDATVFFLMEGDRLFAMDARRLVYHGRDILSHAAATMEVQRFLRNLAESPYLPAGADEILKVEHIRESRSHYALVCRVVNSGTAASSQARRAASCPAVWNQCSPPSATVRYTWGRRAYASTVWRGIISSRLP